MKLRRTSSFYWNRNKLRHQLERIAHYIQDISRARRKRWKSTTKKDESMSILKRKNRKKIDENWYNYLKQDKI